MGRMAKIAEDHWKRWLPKAYGTITDRAAFFQELEDEAATQIDELADDLAGEDQIGETFSEKIGRLRAARQMAEERVFRDVLMPEPEHEAKPETPQREDPDKDFEKAVADFHAAMAELRARRPAEPPE